MSWFFGKKKHRESPPDSLEGEPAPSDDEFTIIEKRNQADGKPSSLYPSLSNINDYPPMPTSFQKQNVQENQGNDLSCIPFKLSKELERSMNEDLAIDQLRLDEIVSFIKKISLEDYNYEFNLERDVIAEMNSVVAE